MLHLPALQTAPINSLGMIVFWIAFFAVLLALIITFETTALQWMRWGSFRTCLKHAAIANLVSCLAGFASLYLVVVLGMLGIGLSWAVSLLIEGFALGRLQPAERGRAYRVALAANLVSYLLLILPAYLAAESL
ncbi:MAG: hypothetical protein ACKOC5_20075 [Chloroflexota bacterium]